MAQSSNLKNGSVAADSRPESMSILFQIYAQIIRNSHPAYLSSASRADVGRMASCVQNHVHDRDLSTQRLRSLSGLSETHLRRLFQQMKDISPYKYIMHARIMQANMYSQNGL